jgi:predicted HicB family RNase H-like nuclease
MEQKKNWENKKTVWIDKDLHKKLKVQASQKGVKMGLYVEGLINQSLTKKGEKKDGK